MLLKGPKAGPRGSSGSLFLFLICVLAAATGSEGDSQFRGPLCRLLGTCLLFHFLSLGRWDFHGPGKRQSKNSSTKLPASAYKIL